MALATATGLRVLCRSDAQRAAAESALSAVWAGSEWPAAGLFVRTFDGAAGAQLGGQAGLAAAAATFDGAAYVDALQTARLGAPLLCVESISSTQLVLAEDLRRPLSEGLTVVADRQESGRGRGSNTWESPAGSLAMSVLCHFPRDRAQTLVFVQYVVTLALVAGLRERFPQADVKIKWPNDIYGNGIKIGGVLCQSTLVGNDFHVTVGLGLNLANAEPTTCLNAVVGSAVSREEVLALFFNRFEPMLDTLRRDGFAPLERAYLDNWMHSDQRVTLADGNEQVTIKGLSPSGCLVAEDGAGARHELQPDHNSLDLFQGLLKAKARS